MRPARSMSLTCFHDSFAGAGSEHGWAVARRILCPQDGLSRPPENRCMLSSISGSEHYVNGAAIRLVQGVSKSCPTADGRVRFPGCGAASLPLPSGALEEGTRFLDHRLPRVATELRGRRRSSRPAHPPSSRPRSRRRCGRPARDPCPGPPWSPGPSASRWRSER